MQISVETTEGLVRKLTVLLPEDQISTAVSKKLQELTRTTKIKGFRPGKVPLGVVKKRFGKQVRNEVVADLMQSSFYEAITKEKLRPVGGPNITAHSDKPGEGMEYTATFEIYPEITPVNIDGVKIEKSVVDITEQDIDDMIQTIRKQNQTWLTVERAAVTGDQVTIDFTGKIDNELFEGGSGEAMPVELGSHRMIPGFEDGLTGLCSGEQKNLALTFPENYQAKELASKAVVFDVTVTSVAEAHLPEMDETLAKKLGIEDGNLQTIRADIKQNMQLELGKRVETETKKHVMDKLYELNKLDLPTALVDSEAQAIMERMQSNLTEQGMQVPDIKLDSGMFKAEAERRVTLGLVLSEIVKLNELTVDANKLRQTVENIAASYEHPDEVTKWYYSDKNRLAEVESLVLEENVVEWVLSRADVEQKTKTFNDIMNPVNETKE